MLAASSAEAQTLMPAASTHEVPVLRGHWRLRVPEDDALVAAALGRLSALRFELPLSRWALEELGRPQPGGIAKAAEVVASEQCNGPPTSIEAVRPSSGLSAVVIDCEVMPSWFDRRERIFVVEHPDGSMLLARSDDDSSILDRLAPGTAPGPRMTTEMIELDVCGARIGLSIPAGSRSVSSPDGTRSVLWLHRAHRVPVYGELDIREIEPDDHARRVERHAGSSLVASRFGPWRIWIVVEPPWIDARFGEVRVPLLAECQRASERPKTISIDFVFAADFYDGRAIDLDTIRALLSSARVVRADPSLRLRSRARMEQAPPRRSHLLIAFALVVGLVFVTLGLVLEHR
jgi:hypothetical protein